METDFKNLIKGKKILVTGGTGSIGRVIVRELLSYEPKVIRVLSRDVAKQIAMQNELGNSKTVRFLVGDVREGERLMMASEDIDIIFHAAAFKYVPQGEYNPFEVVKTNVLGTQNVIDATLKTPSVTHFVMISTDKAVAPINTMGASKLLAERMVSSAHYMKGKKNKIFTTVRFGNVLGTEGSVLPAFREQIKRGEIIVTHPEMTRFFMTIPQAVELIFKAANLARGGEIFVLKMPAIAIKDLAEIFVKKYSIQPVNIRFGGVRPGEKINEVLLTSEEAKSTLETDDMFIIVPQVETNDIYSGDYIYPGAKPLQTNAYDTTVAPRMSHDKISELLDRALI